MTIAAGILISEMQQPLKLSLVVAVCHSNRGIGVNGTLPWRIPGDMAFFKKLTTKTNDKDKQNAVIMGRKTWESIPSKFRPLPGRLNVVVSTTLQNVPAGVCLASSFDDAIQQLSLPEKHSQVENVFVIGGASVYKMALESTFCHRIYLTEVLKEFSCDTFLPDFDVSNFELIKLSDVPTDVQEEGDVPYKFCVYQKVLVDNGNGDHVLPVGICVAVELNNGVGLNNALPWPHISKDYQHFISLVTHTDNPDKKSLIIKARKTWESTTEEEEQSLSSAFSIVISKTMDNCPKNVDYLVKSLDEAIDIALKLWKDGTVEKIWILGGKQLFKEAIESSLCRQIHLTRILASFNCDVFFPKFEHQFKLTKAFEEEMDERSQINIRREVYDRI